MAISLMTLTLFVGAIVIIGLAGGFKYKGKK
jgi:hypothetical protein